jgi:hypothetical protein
LGLCEEDIAADNEAADEILSAKAVCKALRGDGRIIINIKSLRNDASYAYFEQHCAVMLLDALCKALTAAQ